MANPNIPCPVPKFFTKAKWQKALANGEHDDLMAFRPVVKLFQPDGTATWLICSVDPQDPDLAFGLCDLGFGCPELGCISLSKLSELRGSLNLPVELERYVELNKPLRHYCNLAEIHGHIVA